MQVQIVRGPTRHKVLNEARRTLGPDPLVLAVRRQAKEGTEEYEWEAVVARETPSAPPAEPATRLPGNGRGLSEFRREVAALRDQGPKTRGRDVVELARKISQAESDILHGILHGRTVPPTWVPIVERLDASGYPKDDALQLLQSIEDETPDAMSKMPDAFRCLRQAIAQRVSVAPANERITPGLVIFCGASGVGKTTLAAKLAADLCLGGAKRPLLGVVLPRRGLGVETLRRCARTLSIEFAEIKNRDALAELALESRNHPVILDSLSVNPRSETCLSELRETLVGAPNAEIHTVVPATYSARDFDTSLSVFGAIGAKRLSITRLDEAPYIGRVLAAAGRANVPIGYVSQGPRIPDDLVRPSMDALLNAVLSTEVVASL